MKKIIFLSIFLSTICSFSFADIIYLKGGKKIEGEILEKNDKYIKVDCLKLGFFKKYNTADIEKIILNDDEEKQPGNTNDNSDISEKGTVLSEQCRIIQTVKYTLYIPAGVDESKRYPLLIALSPSADAWSMINVWKNISEQYKWIIFASSEFQNGIDNNVIMPSLYSSVQEVIRKFSIDCSKIIIAGFSGGGMGAHAFCFLYPDFIRAVIVNTGMMHSHYAQQKAVYPRNKIAVFLASPTDFRYEEMKRDCEFLKSLGWTVNWIEFEGGHCIAPGSAYQSLAQWLNVRL